MFSVKEKSVHSGNLERVEMRVHLKQQLSQGEGHVTLRVTFKITTYKCSYNLLSQGYRVQSALDYDLIYLSVTLCETVLSWTLQTRFVKLL